MGRNEGKVVCNKRYNEGTLTVLVTRIFTHPKYFKKIKKSKKYLVHCESKKKYELGDNVKIITCAPISKRKSWKILEEGISLGEEDRKND